MAHGGDRGACLYALAVWLIRGRVELIRRSEKRSDPCVVDQGAGGAVMV